MDIYLGVLLLIFCNMIIFRKNKKYFVISSFFILFLIAGLRKYTIGIDLELHYAKNFIQYSQLNFQQLALLSTNSYYDFGLIFFMKILSLINSNEQFFILVTSGITYGLYGRYIYKHSNNVYMETFLFYLCFSYFMYMNIIAQALAISIVLFSIEFLEKKSYIMFLILCLLASLIHSSAIISVIFIPLILMKKSKYDIWIIVLSSIVFLASYSYVLPFILKYVFPQFSFYFENSKLTLSYDTMQVAYLIIFIISFILGINFFSSKSKGYAYLKYNKDNINKGNFLIYVTILSIICRFLAMYNYIYSRIGFYFYPFTYTLLVNSVVNIKDTYLRKVTKVLAYSSMFAFFIIFHKTLTVSYGVLPYEFFWE